MPTNSKSTITYERLASLVDKERISRALDELAKISDPAYGNTGVTRLTLTDYDLKGKNFVAQLMKEAHLDIHVSEIGNTFGRLSGPRCDTKAVLTGSHTDSVVNGGHFDGIVGVVCGIEALRILNEVKDELVHPLEVIDFTGEESARFGLSVFGSKVFMGELKEESLQLRDSQGVSLAQALQRVQHMEHFQGAKTSNWTDENAKHAVAHSRADASDIRAYVELHVEQAGFLEENSKPIGIVSGAAMPTRWAIDIIGEQAHSGTTPMERRKNALVGASEFVLLVDKICKEESQYGTVGAVTKLTVEPNVMNTVPGHCSLFLDVRSTDKASKDRTTDLLLKKLEEICKIHGLYYSYKVIGHDDPKTFSADIMAISKKVCEALATSYMVLPSRAGHDACTMSNHIKEVGMIFVPSKGGVSHHHDEWSDIDDIVLGTKILLLTLYELATNP
ncbi:MAG TPA: M20 family metallo-hydrolase [Oculatellaceae cyanobacterium]